MPGEPFQNHMQHRLFKDRRKSAITIPPEFPHNLTADKNEQKKLITVTTDIQLIFNELKPKIKAVQDQLEKIKLLHPANEEVQASKLQIETQVRAIHLLIRDVDAFKSGKNIEFNSKQIGKKLSYIRKSFNNGIELITTLKKTNIIAEENKSFQVEGESLAPPPPPPMEEYKVIRYPEDLLLTVNRSQSTSSIPKISHSIEQKKLQTEKKYARQILMNETSRIHDRLEEINARLIPIKQALNNLNNEISNNFDNQEVLTFVNKAKEFILRIEYFFILIFVLQNSIKEWLDRTHPDYKQFQTKIAFLLAKNEDPIAKLYQNFAENNANYLIIQTPMNELRKSFELEARQWLDSAEKEYGEALKDSAQLVQSIKEKINPSIVDNSVFTAPPPPPDFTIETKEPITKAKYQRKIGKQPSALDKKIDLSSLALNSVQKFRQEINNYYCRNEDFIFIKNDMEKIITKFLNGHPNIHVKIKAHLLDILVIRKAQIINLQNLQSNLNDSDKKLVDKMSTFKNNYYDITEWCKKFKKMLVDINFYIQEYEKDLQKEEENLARIAMNESLTHIQWELLKLIDSKENEYRTSHSDFPQKNSIFKDLYYALEKINEHLESLYNKKILVNSLKNILENDEKLKPFWKETKKQNIKIG